MPCLPWAYIDIIVNRIFWLALVSWASFVPGEICHIIYFKPESTTFEKGLLVGKAVLLAAVITALRLVYGSHLERTVTASVARRLLHDKTSDILSAPRT